MTERNEAEGPLADREIVIERLFDAPRPLVWDAWTQREHVGQWWGPRGMNTRVEELDLRPGGRWRYVLVAPDGSEYLATGTFREVVPFERIVTAAEFEEGPDSRSRVVLTCIFEEAGDKTKLTMRIEYSTAEDRRQHEVMGVANGWGSNFDCLADYLATLVSQSASRP